MRRSSMTISPMTNSATLRVLEKGALKIGTPKPLRRVEINLVDANAEAADGDQPVGGAEDFRRDPRARADAEDMHALDRFDERLAVERLRQPFEVAVANPLLRTARSRCR